MGDTIPGEDITNRRFNDLVAKKYAGRDKHRAHLWECDCDCGNKTTVPRAALLRGGTKSCGCRLRGNRADLTDRTFGYLKAVRYSHAEKRSMHHWECTCECGNTVVVAAKNLISGRTVSCGCKSAELRKPGLDKYRESVSFDGTKLDALKAKTRKDSVSGVKGVGKSGTGWRARIVFQGKEYHLGVYPTIEQAAEARREAEELLFDPILEEHGFDPTSEEEYQERLKAALEKLKEQDDQEKSS